MLKLKIARQSFNKGVWSEINPDNKKKILLKLADLIEQNRETFARRSSFKTDDDVRKFRYGKICRNGLCE